MKVTVLGAAGGIGQPLSLLLKLSSQIDELSLYDIRLSKGVATDLSHINTNVKVTGFEPSSKEDQSAIKQALTGTDVVIIPAGVPRKPGMTRDDLFNINASIIQSLASAIAETAPQAYVLVISNPVNSTVPIVVETFKQKGVFNPKRIFGVTTLDIVRANSFIKEYDTHGELDVSKVNINVIGGHSGETIVPIYSQSNASKIYKKLSSSQRDALVNRVQFGGDEVVKAKNGGGSATLSMAYSGYKFAESLIRALKGESGIIEDSFIYLDDGIKGAREVKNKTKLNYVSLPIRLGPHGVEEVEGGILGELDDNETKLFGVAVNTLSKNIVKGELFVNKVKSKL
ncbi:Malate dehydrogenase [Wickerhamomyces ciferrii]|uniref:Malate dehydrogenase n=1 Tax=Wickerhamomyces ciferrii (strain ATCC 14091 / BCRC 22168 / CBS 111 / JCM 3599 / NBRC 0793 / NRRL Y-1031 F-60-10) TaxID=1206466 RepID=K0K7L6_WICCF|nr:Malate dehydrogenase [Wickerhamomyces ciferrii]CCH40800.1 Malate dehydrogenase [Wickerhamomyces ciferrii]